MQVAMVANLLVAEREARIDRVERNRSVSADDGSGFANDPFRPIAALVAMLVLAAVGRMILL
ncbi:MAG TPA: hypothetical protein VH482_29970 [Thermomicrobiales bacterium]